MRVNKEGAFTLIEVLIVVFIVSVVALAATLTFGSREGARAVSFEAQRLVQLVELLAQTAVLEQTDYGIGWWRNGYTFWRFDPANDRWELVEREGVLNQHRLPATMTLTLSLAKVACPLAPAARNLTGPQVYFSAAGGASAPATITLANPDTQQVLTIRGNGQVSMEVADE